MGINHWMVLVGSWLLFIAGGLKIAGYDFSYDSLMRDGNRLMVLAEGLLEDIWYLASDQATLVVRLLLTLLPG